MVALLAAPAATPAQDLGSGQAPAPRVEAGVGGGWFFSGGTMPYDAGILDIRIGLRLSRNWSLEGLVHLMPGSDPGISGYYAVQAVRRVGEGRLQPFVAFGGAGEFSRWSWPEYRYNDYHTGEPRVIPAGSRFNIGPPWYPTAGAGVEKILASHVAVRAEVSVGFGVNDYGIAAAFLPSVSVSIPFGRYRKPSR